MRMARDRGIIVNAVQAGGARDTERVWREIAQRGDGRYIPIPQDGGQVVIIETPCDIEIIELQGRINGTVIPYGPRAQRSSVEQKTRQVAAAPRRGRVRDGGLSEQEREAALRREAVTGRGDLVADVTPGAQKLDSVKDDDLPDTLRAMKPERAPGRDRQAAWPSARRSTSAWPSWSRSATATSCEQRKNAPAKPADSFDRAVAETLKAQIKR